MYEIYELSGVLDLLWRLPRFLEKREIRELIDYHLWTRPVINYEESDCDISLE